MYIGPTSNSGPAPTSPASLLYITQTYDTLTPSWAAYGFLFLTAEWLGGTEAAELVNKELEPLMPRFPPMNGNTPRSVSFNPIQI